MLQFEGDKTFPQRPATVWAKLSDAAFLVECIPDLEKVTVAEADHAACVVRPGFSFVRGSLELSAQMLEKVPDQSVRVAVESKGIASSSTVEIAMTLTPRDEGSVLHWVATVSRLGGLLKAVPSGLIRAAAQRIVNDMWAGVDKKLAA